jgi:AcrR family transcriptional regulator
VFWRRGFEGTAISDLEAATGLGRQSLYNRFGDKAGIFRAVLEHYRRRTHELLAPLRRANAGLPAIARFFATSRDAQRSVGCCGCLAARAAAELPSDPALRGIAVGSTQEVRDAFAVILARAIGRGEIRDRRPAAVLADYLWAVGNGAAPLAAGGDDAVAARVVRTALDLLAAR